MVTLVYTYNSTYTLDDIAVPMIAYETYEKYNITRRRRDIGLDIVRFFFFLILSTRKRYRDGRDGRTPRRCRAGVTQKRTARR